MHFYHGVHGGGAESAEGFVLLSHTDQRVKLGDVPLSLHRRSYAGLPFHMSKNLLSAIYSYFILGDYSQLSVYFSGVQERYALFHRLFFDYSHILFGFRRSS